MFGEEIDLSNQGITSLRGFEELQKIRRPSKVDLSNNPLTSLEHIASSNSLVALRLDDTDITSFLGTKPQPALREVSLRNTPVSRAPLYRVACILAFGPKLKLIDSVPVTASERDAAFRFGADAAVAVSFGWLPPNTVDRSGEEYAKIVRSLHADRRAAAGRINAAAESAVTVAHVAEKCMLLHPPGHSHHHHQAGGATSNNIMSSTKSASPSGIMMMGSSKSSDEDAQTIIALRARIAELESTVKDLTTRSTSSILPGTTANVPSADGGNKNDGSDDVQQQQKTQTDDAAMTSKKQSDATVARPMRVPGVMPSELETIDTVTWAAPTTTMYSFITGGATTLAPIMSSSSSPALSPLHSGSSGGDASSSSSVAMKLPQCVALTLTRHTLELQKLMSRQALFRQPLSLLASVQAAEVGDASAAIANKNNSSPTGGFNSSPASSNKGSRNALGPFRTTASLQMHFSDGCSALMLFTSKTAMNTVFKALKYRCCSISKTISFSFDADVESLTEWIAPGRGEEELVDLFSKPRQVIVGAGSPVLSAGAGGAASSSTSNASPILPPFLPPNGGIGIVRANEAPSSRGPGSARPPISAGGSGQASARKSSDADNDSEFALESNERRSNGGDSSQASPMKDGDASGAGGEDGEGEDGEEEEEEEEEKPRGGLRGPGGTKLVIPTGIKVGGGRTPVTTTPAAGTPQQSTTPASIGLDGAWKGRKIVAKVSSSDSDEDSSDD